MTVEVAQRLQRQVLNRLKRRFVGREEIVDLIALAVTAGEHLFLLGPPGTAKSALIRQFAQMIRGSYFEYLLTRFSEPNELFGPVDLVKLRQGTVAIVTKGMLPEADVVFLDELFNANSAILNNLLTVLNERVYRRGAEVYRLPLLSLFSASNHLPEDEALAALFDRFLLRARVESLPREDMPKLLAAGWAMECGGDTDGADSDHAPADDAAAESAVPVTADDLRQLARQVLRVDLSGVYSVYADAVVRLRDLGIAFSDRRAVKVLKLIAASAVLCGRQQAIGADLWVLRYVWDRVEQIAPLGMLVAELLKASPEDAEPRHRLARLPEQADAAELAQQLEQAESRLTGQPLSLLELARLREEVVALTDRAAWVADAQARAHLLQRGRTLLSRF
jgi:MoxR-like ATPase